MNAKEMSEHYYRVVEDLERQRAQYAMAIYVCTQIAASYGEQAIKEAAQKSPEQQTTEP